MLFGSDYWRKTGTCWAIRHKAYRAKSAHPATDDAGEPDLQLLEGKRVTYQELADGGD